jgi:hypothetical protein
MNIQRARTAVTPWIPYPTSEFLLQAFSFLRNTPAITPIIQANWKMKKIIAPIHHPIIGYPPLKIFL